MQPHEESKQALATALCNGIWHLCQFSILIITAPDSEILYATAYINIMICTIFCVLLRSSTLTNVLAYCIISNFFIMIMYIVALSTGNLDNDIVISCFIMIILSVFKTILYGVLLCSQVCETPHTREQPQANTNIPNHQRCTIHEAISHNGMCVICQEQFSSDVPADCALGCRHKFHKACIEEWVNNGHSCPICREFI